MRVLALLLLAFLCPATASSEDWCSQPICARLEGSDAIRILAPGRFELTFTKAEGFGQEVYDLEADPGRLYDLSAALPENGILWTKITELGVDGSYYANNATDLAVLEPGGVRVRVSHGGKHYRYGIPSQPWNDLGYVQTFTVYATGEVYVDYALLASRDIPLYGFTLIVKSTFDWGNDALASAPGEAHCVAEHGLDPPYGATASSFAMVSSNGSRYDADLLMALYDGVYNGSYWNEGYPGHDFRCGLWVGGRFPNATIPAGTSHIPILMRIGEDMNDAASAAKYADGFRSPDAALAVIQGVEVLTDPGDRDGDGFNEEKGAYVVRRQGSQAVELVLHGDRVDPVFEVRDWGEAAPQRIRVDGALWEQGAQFRASLSGPDLILELLGERTTDTHVVLPVAECENGVDDDGDGLVDYPADTGCTSADDLSEHDPTRPCDDGVDDDGDGKIDYLASGGGDPGCRDALSPTESPQCQDGLNNDNRLGIDFDGGFSLDLDRDGFVDARFNPATPALTAPDPDCGGKAWANREARPGCGLGFELVALAPLLRRLARKRRA